MRLVDIATLDSRRGFDTLYSCVVYKFLELLVVELLSIAFMVSGR